MSKTWKNTFNDDPLIQTLNAEMQPLLDRVAYLKRLRWERHEKLFRQWKYTNNYRGFRDKMLKRAREQTARKQAKRTEMLEAAE